MKANKEKRWSYLCFPYAKHWLTELTKLLTRKDRAAGKQCCHNTDMTHDGSLPATWPICFYWQASGTVHGLLSAVWLSALCYLLSAVCCLLSAVCYLLSGCLLSALCSLLSAVCSLLSAVCCLLSAVCSLLSGCMLSAICSLLSALCCLTVCCPLRQFCKIKWMKVTKNTVLGRIYGTDWLQALQHLRESGYRHKHKHYTYFNDALPCLQR